MTPETAARHCGRLQGATVDHPFGPQPAVYKIGGKMFALVAEDDDPPSVSLKLPPEEVRALRAQYEGTVLPGYHLNKRHWVTVLLDGTLDDAETLALIRQSYDTVVDTLPKRLKPV